jgi:hypothetical protein
MRKGKLKKVDDQWVIEHAGYDDFGMPIVGIETPLFPGPFPLPGGVYIDEILIEGKEYDFEFEGKFARIIIPRKTKIIESESRLLEKILAETSLETSLRISFAMSDYENWEDGKYLGDEELINNQVESALHIIEAWVEKGQTNPIRNS